MNLPAKKGFTLIEILAALVIIGFLISLAASQVRERAEDGEIVAALNQMNSIRKAVTDGFYRDFGCIPEEVHVLAQSGPQASPRYYQLNMNPEYATRFLCLPRDCSNSEIMDLFNRRWDRYGNWIDEEDFRPGCYFMFQCLDKINSERLGNLDYYAVSPLIADPVCGSGSWTGPYLEANSRFDATALNQKDDTQYPYEFYSDYGMFEDDHVFLPVISTPWADDLEEAALEAEASDLDLAAELRKGKYYQILVYSRNTGEVTYSPSGEIRIIRWSDWIQVPETAVVISRGPDGLPGAEGDDQTVGAEDYWKECAGMWQHGLTTQQRQCFDRLMITDPDDPEYVDIGDDMVLFIFGGGTVRSPLDR
jgi:prepilin-type N-terminal cleavage/methylation domain-containing protein